MRKDLVPPNGAKKFACKSEMKSSPLTRACQAKRASTPPYKHPLRGPLSFVSVALKMVSVERILEYCDLEPEGALEKSETKPGTDWPKYGIISGEKLSFAYHSSLPLVLKDLYFCIRSKEKVRTSWVDFLSNYLKFPFNNCPLFIRLALLVELVLESLH